MISPLIRVTYKGGLNAYIDDKIKTMFEENGFKNWASGSCGCTRELLFNYKE